MAITKATAKKSATAAKLPQALAKRAQKAAAEHKRELAAQGRTAIGIIRRRMEAISESFYDIGEALKVVKQPDVFRALGYPSFASLLKAEVGLSLSHATRLIAIVERVSRDEALRLGQTRATALIELADATPELDSPVALSRKRALQLPGGETLDVSRASPREVGRAATAVRAAKQPAGSKARGLSLTAEDRAFAATLQKRCRDFGAKRAAVRAIARHNARAELEIKGVSIDEVAMLKKALGK